MNLQHEKGALDVMIKARESAIKEIFLCGQTGSIARAANYAVSLNNLTEAIHNLTFIIESDAGETERRQALIDRLNKARAAKKAKEEAAAALKNTTE